MFYCIFSISLRSFSETAAVLSYSGLAVVEWVGFGGDMLPRLLLFVFLHLSLSIWIRITIGLGTNFWICLCWVGIFFLAFCFFSGLLAAMVFG